MNEEIYRELINIRNKIKFSSKDLKDNSILISNLEKKITLFHAESVVKNY